MSTPKPLSEKEATELVAYLDGELEGPAAQAVEKRLARDRVARAEAAALRQAWELLDLLPQAEPSASFTHRTLQKLAPAQTQSSRQAPPQTLAAPLPAPRTLAPTRTPARLRRVLGGAAWAAALVVAFAAGYTGFNRLHPPESSPAVEPLRDFHVEDADEAKELCRIFDDNPVTLPDKDQATRLGLLEGLARYADWREHLSDEERGRIDAAKTRDERLAVIRQLREEQWIRTLVLRDREELAKLSGEARVRKIAQLRQEEAEQDSSRRWRGPTHVEDYPPSVQQFFDRNIRPRLNAWELAQLRQVEGDGPALARMLQELSEKHPYLPGIAPHDRGPVRAEELPLFSGMQLLAIHLENLTGHVKPRVVQKWAHQPPFQAMRSMLDYLDERRLAHRLQAARGKWPEYAHVLTDIVRNHSNKTTVALPLGASKPDEFSDEVRAFLKTSLVPALNAEEARQLRNLEGKWPDYPEQLYQLAQKYHLAIPGLSLPLTREMLEEFTGSPENPEVPARVLRQFALAELTPEERAALKLDISDPRSVARLRNEYDRRKNGPGRRRFPEMPPR